MRHEQGGIPSHVLVRREYLRRTTEDRLDDERALSALDDVLDSSFALVSSSHVRIARWESRGGPQDFPRNQIGVDDLDLWPPRIEKNPQGIAVLRKRRLACAVDARDQDEPRAARTHAPKPSHALVRFTRFTAN
jgi:hypothetical protein